MPKTTLRPKNLEFQPRPAYPYWPGTKGGNIIFTAGEVIKLNKITITR